MYTAGTASTPLPEKFLCELVCPWRWSSLSSTGMFAMCTVKKISSRTWGLCSGLRWAPSCMTVWACDSVYPHRRQVHLEGTTMLAHERAELTATYRIITYCDGATSEDRLHSLDHVTKLCAWRFCCLWVRKWMGGGDWSEISQAEREREEHMWTVKRVIQQPLWYPPLVWLQLAGSLVKKWLSRTKECSEGKKNLISKIKLSFSI